MFRFHLIKSCVFFNTLLMIHAFWEVTSCVRVFPDAGKDRSAFNVRAKEPKKTAWPRVWRQYNFSRRLATP